ncbi:MAG: ThiF family adenylyltransferase, partial [Dehalococcoidales bacterium]|nr:ThiF family adenylyltransferase [Dehalococcoidales bacterium]
MLTENERQRYDRQILIHGFGEEGQARLKETTVFLAGAGGLGSPAAIYLAAAGIGHIRIVDADSVDISNLNRQILHWDENLGEPKTESASGKLTRLNPTIHV